MFERTLLAIGIALLAVSLEGCGEKAASPAKAAKTAEKGAGPAATAPTATDPLTTRLTPELGALVKLGTIATSEVTETIRIAGRLEVNGYKTARIGAPVTGRISDIKAIVGQEVKAGETLADINSQELTLAQLGFLKAHSALQLSTRAVERAELLLSADVIGSAELQRRQNEQTVARAEKRAAADQLRILGLSAAAVERLERSGSLIASAPISSTQAGTVIERKVAQGQVVQPTDALFVVSDLRSIWAGADIPEQEAASVRRGQRVEIEIPALGNEKRVGRIVFVADVVNAETRTVRVGVDLENIGKTLKPAMLITMLIEGKAAQRQLVPLSAVVRENDADHLFVETAPGVVRLTKVELDIEKDGKRALKSALPPNTRIVLDGGFHLNNERQRRNLEKAG